MEFFQEKPTVPQFIYSSSQLRNLIESRIDPRMFESFAAEISSFAKRTQFKARSFALDAESHPPRHTPFDAWGNRVDEIKVSPGWKSLGDFSAEEGLIATAYERRFGSESRLLQFAKLFLFHADSAFFSCPLAMTDGAARILEIHGTESTNETFSHLTSRDPDRFWTSGQWMTERTGGSDVSATSTIAKATDNGSGYQLFGVKWFTSAATSEVAMALARTEGASPGSRGLSLFLLRLRDENGHLKNIEILRLKDKLGTQALPTAEIELKGCPAILVGPQCQGVKMISTLINITRLHNSVCALSATRRVLDLARDYSAKRLVFGRHLLNQPLNREVLTRLEVEYEGWMHLMFELAHLIGKEESDVASEQDKALLRILTPVLKALTAKACMSITSEVIEIFGGAGYIEDTGLPKWLRDAQIFSIWEGSTNVLSLDVLRSIEKEQTYIYFERATIENLSAGPEVSLGVAVAESLQFLNRHLDSSSSNQFIFQSSARDFLESIGRTFVASLLIKHAQKSRNSRDQLIAALWIKQGICPIAKWSDKTSDENKEVLDSLQI